MYSRKKNMGELKFPFIFTVILTLIAVLMLTVFLSRGDEKSPSDGDAAVETAENGDVDALAETIPPADTQGPMSGTDNAVSYDTPAASSSQSTEPVEVNVPEPIVDNWDYTVPVPESEAVSDDYFDDAIFIGNSRTEGFALYSGLENVRAYYGKGIMVDNIFTKPEITRNGEKITIIDAIKQDGSFSKAYIMMGLNELGWVYMDVFIDNYGKIIDTIREINPNAKIYVQSILPVAKSKSDSDSIYNNDNIDKFNDYIKKMCADKKIYYLNVAEAVSGTDGALPEEATTDGIHLKSEYCKKWLDYLKTHAVPEADW